MSCCGFREKGHLAAQAARAAALTEAFYWLLKVCYILILQEKKLVFGGVVGVINPGEGLILILDHLWSPSPQAFLAGDGSQVGGLSEERCLIPSLTA